jgi:hypothetical protein
VTERDQRVIQRDSRIWGRDGAKALILSPARRFRPFAAAMRLPGARDAQIMFLTAAAFYVNMIMLAASIVAAPFTERIPYHNSAMSGRAWLDELLNGHPDRIQTELGMRKHVFLAYVHALRLAGCADSPHLQLDEQVAIFLYMCVTGLSIRHVGERFQRTNETVSKCVILQSSFAHTDHC